MRIEKYYFLDNNLIEYWNEIESKNNFYGFQSQEWIINWIENLGLLNKKLTFFFYVVIENEKPIAIFPFELKKLYFFKILSLIGDNQTDYKSPIFDKEYFDERSIKRIWVSLKNHLPSHDVINFTNVPENIGLNKNPFLMAERFEPYSLSFFINLSNKNNLNFISKRSLKDLDRYTRRLSELGSFTFKEVKTEDEFKKIIKFTIFQKIKRYKKTGGLNHLSKLEVQSFYKYLFKNKLIKFTPHLTYLSIDNEIIASHLGFYDADRYYYYMPTFKEKYSKYSPGRILLKNLISNSISKKHKFFDLTIGEESYKEKWGANKMQIYQFIEASSLKGILLKIYFVLINKIKKSPMLRFYYLKFKKFKVL